MKTAERRELEGLALEVRKDIVRMTGVARSGNIGSSLSLVDILVYLYWKVLRIRPEEPHWPARDRVVLSKSHACPALYAVLANRGFFDRSELWNFRRLGAMLQGHPEMVRTPGVDAPGGSVGMGIGIANGLMLASGFDGLDSRVFCILGDGELQEGSIWESAMKTPDLGSGKIIALVDMNGMQMDGPVKDIRNIEPLREKFESFRWTVVEADGHDFDDLEGAFALALKRADESPSVILARTVPGKGFSLAEKGLLGYPSSPMNRERMEQALREMESATGGTGKGEDL